MLRQDCKVGMTVSFGRDNGEQTVGEVVKMNPAKAKVCLLESRGNGRGSRVGATWSVPYSMMEVATAVPSKVSHPVEEKEISAFLYGVDYHIMMAIVDCYSGLSPENLSCDGEASATHIRNTSARLHNQIKHLQNALGQPVSESAAYAWWSKVDKR